MKVIEKFEVVGNIKGDSCSKCGRPSLIKKGATIELPWLGHQPAFTSMGFPPVYRDESKQLTDFFYVTSLKKLDHGCHFNTVYHSYVTDNPKKFRPIGDEVEIT